MSNGKKNNMKKALPITLSIALIYAPWSLAEDTSTEAKMQALEVRISELEANLEEKIDLLADAVESQSNTEKNSNAVHIGGYGELHYQALDANGEDDREIDFHRMVLFFGYDFSEKARFITELEIEHIIASNGSRGAVELEQAYVEIDLADRMFLQTGAMLMPIGIINETHEPPTFYGVERPIVETTIIPTTWWSAGVKFTQQFNNGLSYDLMISDGLKTEDPNADPSAEPFNLKLGKQKGSFADAYDLAITGRLSYRPKSGLEFALYTQYQPDLDQSAVESYADSATLIGGHTIYTWNKFSARALYARWDLAGEEAEAAGKHVQDGGYIEASWKINEAWGIFARQSTWSLQEDINANQTDIGVNFYPHQDIVYKFNYQLQNDDAGNTEGVYLGMGYHF